MVTSTLNKIYPMIASPRATREKVAERILTELLKITGSSGGFITFHGEKLASKGEYTHTESTPIIIEMK